MTLSSPSHRRDAQKASRRFSRCTGHVSSFADSLSGNFPCVQVVAGRTPVKALLQSRICPRLSQTFMISVFLPKNTIFIFSSCIFPYYSLKIVVVKSLIHNRNFRIAPTPQHRTVAVPHRTSLPPLHETVTPIHRTKTTTHPVTKHFSSDDDKNFNSYNPMHLQKSGYILCFCARPIPQHL